MLRPRRRRARAPRTPDRSRRSRRRSGRGSGPGSRRWAAASAAPPPARRRRSRYGCAISPAVWPGWTLARRKRRRSGSKRNTQRPVTSAYGPPGAIDLGGAGAGRADELDLRHQHARRMLLAEQDHPRHQEIEIGGAERAGPAHPASRIAADADQVDVGLAVDLAAAEEEGVDPALRGAVEQLAAAVGERVVPLAAENRDPQRRRDALARASSAAAPGIGEAAPTATWRRPASMPARTSISSSCGR